MESSPPYQAGINQTYSYEALQGSDIRIATLEPGSAADPISISLRHVGPQDEPKFEALSYTWGDPKDVCSLQCGGAPLTVTKNLFSALVRLRDGQNPRDIWIDAVCINQADLQERSLQVSLMKYIYSAATKVIIWLGEDEVTSDGQAASVAGRAVALFKAWASRSALKLTNTVPISADFLIDTYEARANVACIQSLLARPWWSRAWVFQELCLAKEADIVCGESCLPWTVFDNACFAIGRSIHMDDLFDTTYASSMRIYYSLLRPTKGKRAETSRIISLSQLLYETNSRSATDPRDKVYALLGLAWYGSSEALPYPVDYSLPTEIVYTQYTKGAIKKERSLAILSHVRVSESTSSGLPSWVPDWRQDPSTKPLSYVPSGCVPVYNATLGQKYNDDPQRKEVLMELRVQGWVVDSVRSVLRIRHVLKNYLENLKELHWRSFFVEIRRFQIALALDDEYSSNCEHSDVALIRTLMADDSPVSERVPDTSKVIRFPYHFGWFIIDPATGKVLPRDLGDLLGTDDERALCHRQLLDARKAIKQLYHCLYLSAKTTPSDGVKLLGPITVPQTSTASPFSPEKSYYESDEARSEIAREIVSGAAWRGGRVLFTTHQGFLGLGPPSTQIGDQACLIFGGEVPYILRPRYNSARNTWEFIGEAYIHGWMDGELMTEKDSHLEVVDFILV